ncbi:hypothetical protein TNCV_2667431 [Trichonephila clavipes]|nr:hypothetical protein TNCV_2667431 [Trichonephila clavipes]
MFTFLRDTKQFNDMKSKSNEISISERKIIVKMWKDGKSRRDIAISVGRQYYFIQRVIDHFKSTGIYSSNPRPGRSSKLTIRERRNMISLLKKNPRSTTAQIAIYVNEKFNKKHLCRYCKKNIEKGWIP